jgi:hypothetical protein
MKNLSAFIMSLCMSVGALADQDSDLDNMFMHINGISTASCKQYITIVQLKDYNPNDDPVYGASLALLSGINMGLTLKSMEMKAAGLLDSESEVKLLEHNKAFEDQRSLLNYLYDRCKMVPKATIGAVWSAWAASELEE